MAFRGTVLVQHPDPATREGWAARVREAAGPGCRLAGLDDPRGLRLAARTLVPDVVVIPGRQPGATAAELVAELEAETPGLPWAFLLVLPGPGAVRFGDALEAMRAGVVDCIEEGADAGALLRSLQHVQARAAELRGSRRRLKLLDPGSAIRPSRNPFG